MGIQIRRYAYCHITRLLIQGFTQTNGLDFFTCSKLVYFQSSLGSILYTCSTLTWVSLFEDKSRSFLSLTMPSIHIAQVLMFWDVDNFSICSWFYASIFWSYPIYQVNFQIIYWHSIPCIWHNSSRNFTHGVWCFQCSSWQNFPYQRLRQTKVLSRTWRSTIFQRRVFISRSCS